MPVFRLVNLGVAYGSHVTEYGFAELTAALNEESLCRLRVSRIRPGAICLNFPDRTPVDAELTQILERIQFFTSQFISVVIFLSKEDAYKIKDKLTRTGYSIELSGETVGDCGAGELFRVTGIPDNVNRFLSTFRAITIEESNIVLECTNKQKSFGMLMTNGDVTEVLETSDEDWEFLKLTHFDEMVSQIYPQVRVKSLRPGCIQLSGDGGGVRKVLKEVHRFLDNRKVHTYFESKTIVECLKLSWCTDLLRRKWVSAKVAATVVVDKHKNTALIKSGGELAIALLILESTIKEAQPIPLPKELMFPLKESIRKAIEAATDGKAVAVVEEKLRQICVAGNAEKLTDVVEQVRKLVVPGEPSNAFPITLPAAPSVVEVVKRYYDKEISERACSEAACTSTSFFIRYTADKFLLEGDPTAVKIAEQELTSLMTSIIEISHSPRNCHSRHTVSQIEQETRTFIQLVEMDYGQQAINIDGRSSAAVLRSAEKKGSEKRREAVETEASTRRCLRTDHEGLLDYSSEGSIYPNLELQVVQGSVCDLKADVLVNSITKSLNLKTGAVSMAFDRAAGWLLQDELYKKGTATDFSVLCTKGYDLHCEQVLHVVCGPRLGQQSDEKLKELIYLCLRSTEDRKMTSIAFPPIGAGGLGYPIESVVGAFYKAVYDFNQERHQHLKSITCAIFDYATLKEFEKAQLKLQGRLPHKSSSQKLDMHRNASEHWEETADFLATSGLPFILKITGKKSDVGRAVQEFDDLENNRGINKKAEKDMDYFGDCRQSYSTSQSTPSDDERPSGGNSSFGVATTSYPQKFKEGYNTITSQSAYDMTDDAVLVKRIASQLDDSGIKYARYWMSMVKETFKVIPVDAYQQEYSEVTLLMNDFHKSFSTETMKIFRIQDKTQWKLYCEQHERMKRGNPDAKWLQRMLWFSCPQEGVFDLLKAGHLLSRSNSVRQDCGKGAYFYRDATDATRVQISTASAQGAHCIVLASVLTGRFIVGNASMVTLPQLPTGDKKYDSSVDSMGDPRIFVIYHDAQACPLYCITFKACQK